MENRADPEQMLPEISYLEVLEWDSLAIMREFLRKSHDGFFSFIDADKVVSLEQVRICYSKSLKIVETATKVKYPESIFLMLLSGRTQISKAQLEIGISSSTKSVLVVYDSDSEFRRFLESCPGIRVKNKIPIPESLKEKDGEIFSKMARVQLSL